MRSCTWSVLLGLVAILGLAPPAQAEDFARKSALDLMPASAVVYVEVAKPPRLFSTLLDHPLTAELKKQPDYQKALETPDMQEVRKVVGHFEEQLGTKWRPALTTLTGDGIYLGIDLATQGVVVLVRSQDEKLLARFRTTFVEAVRQEAARKGEGDPFKFDEYKGISVFRLDKALGATLGPWLVVTNKPLLGRMVLDNALGQGAGSLATEPQFQSVRKQRQGEPTIWAYADLTVVRATGIAKKALAKKSDNPGTELLLGGILEAIPEAPYVTASLDWTADRIAVSTTLPYDTRKVTEKRAFYFGPQGGGTAPPLLRPKETLLSLSTYRNFGQFWKHAPDLFDDNVNARFAEAESNLTTLFSGRSFGDDILDNLEPGLQLVVTRQRFGQDDIVPAIKLPAVAAVLTMKKPAETARQFKITYQSLIGFLNVAGGQNGLEPLEQNTEKIGPITVVSAEYLPPDDDKRQDAAIHFNASPTVAFVGDKFVLASTKALAVELAQLVSKPAASEPGLNTLLSIEGRVLRDVLSDNRRQLVAQNQLEKGHDQAAAENEIDLLLKLLRGFHGTALKLTSDDQALELSWELKMSLP